MTQVNRQAADSTPLDGLIAAGNDLASGHSMKGEERWERAKAAAPDAPLAVVAAGDALAGGHSMKNEEAWKAKQA